MIRNSFLLLMVFVTAVLAVIALLTDLKTTYANQSQAVLVLYDGSLGTLPADQKFEYTAVNPDNPPLFSAQAVQTYSPTLATAILDTTPIMNDYAGYTVTPTIAPTLNRTDGFTLAFSIGLMSETHDNNDRAGFSISLLAEDLQGIEVAFWEDEIWVQEDGPTNDPPLFTHAEGISYTTTGLTDYELAIISDTYHLYANGAQILTGPVRDYTAWEPPTLPPPFQDIQLPDPYEQPNLIALSDNTSSAQAKTLFSYAAIITADLMNQEIYLPVVLKNP